jgi:hypothetical protein
MTGFKVKVNPAFGAMAGKFDIIDNLYNQRLFVCLVIGEKKSRSIERDFFIIG